MPNPVNRQFGEQWDTCAICGRFFPLSQLVQFKGAKRCQADVDDLQRERRDLEVQQILGAPTSQPEGSDRRNVDQAFFAGSDTDIQV